MRRWLKDKPTLVVTHVKWIGNRVADAIANKGLGKRISFHVDENDDAKIDGQLWRICEELAEGDIERIDGVHS